ncbi:SOS response-associated peptidase family protein [Novosphingobium sp. YJ-S2-02]|uniref:Abasic site processing protein n=1 Tax=Novosphingobium aureum TaxID=2792964 RepID=A0A931HA25_9SPHN|nr:SOS response-associated peptidase family protein [Novosphingobium aureum]MBH0111768.1 SOS response-associated peptidase family protein [Novosphingobium aureum]
MCNLYRMTKGTDEVARLFAAETMHVANLADEVYPGYPGMVVAQGAVEVMNWGFPLVLTGKQGRKLKPKPVTNARDDKLHTPFWKDSFVQRRCIIPVSAWAEPEGRSGHMTRTWYAPEGEDLFAVAGLWRESGEWGRVYTMVMVDACAQMVDVHDRMPVLLTPGQWAQWTDAAPEAAFELCRTSEARLQVDRTQVPWAARKSALGAASGAANGRKAGGDAARADDAMPRLL